MTTRLANGLFLAGFILVGIYYLYDSYVLAAANPEAGFGPVQFPIALGVLLIVLCSAEFCLSIGRRDPDGERRLEVPNAGKLAMTVLLTGLYFLVFWGTGQFYPATAVFFFILVMMYKETRTMRSAGIAATVSALFTTALYLVFDLAFSVQLG